MVTIGFLHAAADHVEACRRLVQERAPGAADVHVVDASLLDALPGVDAAARARLGARLGELLGRDVDLVVCTCASLLEEAVRLAARAGVPAVGVDHLVGPASTPVVAPLLVRG